MALLTIGLLIDWLDDDDTGSQAFAFHEEVCSRGMRFLCFIGRALPPPGRTQDGANLTFRLATARCLDALAVASLGTRAVAEECRHIQQFRSLPLCTLGARCAGVPHVSVDDAGGMREAVEHLLAVHLKRRIAFVRGPLGSSAADERFAGYADALRARGLSLDESLVVHGDFSRASGSQAVAQLLAAPRARFDALVAANDAMAAGALDELARQGLRVPNDVAIVGFDDVEASRFSDPPISTVRQPWRARARAAVDILVELCERGTASGRLVPTEFVPRQSCGCGPRFEGTRPAVGGTFSRRVANWDWRKATATGLARELALHGVALDDAPARALVECFWQEVDAEREGGFLLLLEHELGEGLAARASVWAWYYGLARLRRDVLPRLLPDSPAIGKAESLMHAALERVGDAAERQQALRRLSFDRQYRQLVLAGQASSTAFSADNINARLRQQLPELGVPRFYVLSFEPDPERALVPPRSRLVLAETGSASPPEVRSEFDTLELLPRGIWPEQHALGFVVEALHFQDDPLGFALFQIGPRQGAIYMALREQLSTALEIAGLVGQVAQRALWREQAERARMQEELRIARRVQASILPARWQIQGLDVAAALLPGQLPGADYFDVRPDESGAWLCVGSVRGGGLGPGLIVPMLQSIVAALCQSGARPEPAGLLSASLEVLQQNVAQRMRQRQIVNLLVARYGSGGHLSFAGDFEGVTLCPWHGSPFRPNWSIRGESPSGEPLLAGEFQLSPHDLILLHTQGLTRSSDFEDQPVGQEAIGRELEKNRTGPVETIRDGVLGTVRSWSGKRADLSVIVGRRMGPG